MKNFIAFLGSGRIESPSAAARRFEISALCLRDAILKALDLGEGTTEIIVFEVK